MIFLEIMCTWLLCVGKMLVGIQEVLRSWIMPKFIGTHWCILCQITAPMCITCKQLFILCSPLKSHNSSVGTSVNLTCYILQSIRNWPSLWTQRCHAYKELMRKCYHEVTVIRSMVVEICMGNSHAPKSKDTICDSCWTLCAHYSTSVCVYTYI